MPWCEAPTLQEFKEKHYDFEKDCWKHPSSKISYGVLEKYWLGKVKHKSEKELLKEEATKRKEKWEQEKKN